MKKIILFILSLIFLTAGVNASVWNSTLDPGLLHYWEFNIPKGTLTDSVKDYEANLTESGIAPLNMTGIIGQAKNFNSAGAFYAVHDDNLSFDIERKVDFTINFWAKDIDNETANGTYNSFYEKGLVADGAMLRFNEPDKFQYFGSSGESGVSTDVYACQGAGDWCMYTVVHYKNTDVLSIYRNSTFIENVTVGTGGIKPLNNSANLYIGRDNFNGNNANMTIDEYGFWNRTLSSSEIIQVYNNGSGIYFRGFSENSQTFNTTTYESLKEDFIINITYENDTASDISANLVYNGTTFAGTQVGSGATIEFKVSSMSIGLISGSFSQLKEFYWEVTIAENSEEYFFNSTFNNQTVYQIIFGLCNSTLTTSYINFTFVNETINMESINATISSSWTYWLEDAAINKTLTFSNTTEEPSYAFCLYPTFTNLNTALSLTYANSESQQRAYRFQTALLTNLTTNTVLYLLPFGLGGFTRYQTIDANGDTIPNVLATVTRTIGATTVTSGISLTDDSGLVIFFLNPNVVYDYVFSLAGFEDNSFSLNPNSPDIYIITMGTGVFVTNETEILQNTTIQIDPTNTTLQNQTDVVFSLSVNSTESVTFISMNITNSSGDQLAFQSNAGQGFISETINTGNNTRITGYFVIRTADEEITLTKVWFVGEEFEGDYSINRQMRFFMDYNFNEFIRMVLIVLTILVIMIYLSEGEIIDVSEGKIIVIILVMWAFSFFGWLDTGLTLSTTSSKLNQFTGLSSQYGIAILSTAFGMWTIIKKAAI